MIIEIEIEIFSKKKTSIERSLIRSFSTDFAEIDSNLNNKNRKTKFQLRHRLIRALKSNISHANQRKNRYKMNERDYSIFYQFSDFFPRFMQQLRQQYDFIIVVVCVSIIDILIDDMLLLLLFFMLMMKRIVVNVVVCQRKLISQQRLQ